MVKERIVFLVSVDKNKVLFQLEHNLGCGKRQEHFILVRSSCGMPLAGLDRAHRPDELPSISLRDAQLIGASLMPHLQEIIQEPVLTSEEDTVQWC